jgi:hypothetical protein
MRRWIRYVLSALPSCTILPISAVTNQYLTVLPYMKACGCCIPGCFPCPFLTLCDAPAFTVIAVEPSQAILNGSPCTVGVANRSWTGVKAIYD